MKEQSMSCGTLLDGTAPKSTAETDDPVKISDYEMPEEFPSSLGSCCGTAKETSY